MDLKPIHKSVNPGTDKKPDILLGNHGREKAKNTTYLMGVTHPRITFAREMLKALLSVFKYLLRITLNQNRKL